MVLIPLGGNRERTIIPEGEYVAICKYEGDFLKTAYQSTEKEVKVRLIFQLDGRTEGGDRRYQVSRSFTKSLHEKSNLRKFLKKWRGNKDFTDEQLAAFRNHPFDTAKLVGVPALIEISNSETGGKITYDIERIRPLPAGHPDPPFVMEWYAGERERYDQDARDAQAYASGKTKVHDDPFPGPSDDEDTTDYSEEGVL